MTNQTNVKTTFADANAIDYGSNKTDFLTEIELLTMRLKQTASEDYPYLSKENTLDAIKWISLILETNAQEPKGSRWSENNLLAILETNIQENDINTKELFGDLNDPDNINILLLNLELGGSLADESFDPPTKNDTSETRFIPSNVYA